MIFRSLSTERFWRKRINLLNLRKRRSPKLLKPSAKKKGKYGGNSGNNNQKNKQDDPDANIDKYLRRITYRATDNTYYYSLFELMSTIVTASDSPYIFDEARNGVKIQQIHKQREEWLTGYAKKKCIQLVSNSIEGFRSNSGDKNFNLSSYLLKTGLYEAFNIGNFLPGDNKKAPHWEKRQDLLDELNLFINENRRDTDEMSEAIISYMCKAEVFNQEQTSTLNSNEDSNDFANYTSRHGVGLTEIVYSSLKPMLAVWKHCIRDEFVRNHFRVDDKIDSDDEIKNKKEKELTALLKIERSYKSGTTLRNKASHYFMVTNHEYKRVIETNLSATVSEISHFANEDIEKSLNESVKNFIQNIHDKRPQDALNNKFGKHLQLTIPTRNSSTYFLKKMKMFEQGTQDIEEGVNENKDNEKIRDTNAVLEEMGADENLLKCFINGYSICFEEKLNLTQVGSQNLFKGGKLLPYTMGTMESVVQATKFKISMLYEFILSTISEGSNEERTGNTIRVIQKLKTDIGIEPGSRIWTEVSEKFNSLQIMRDFSLKKYTGTSDAKLEKVVEIMNNYLTHLDILTTIAENNGAYEVQTRLRKIIHCVEQVWSRKFTHFNYSLLCPTIDRGYSKWIRMNILTSGKAVSQNNRHRAFFNLGKVSAAEDCKKELEDKKNYEKRRAKINVYVGCKEYKNRINTAVNALKTPAAQTPTNNLNRVGILFVNDKDNEVKNWQVVKTLNRDSEIKFVEETLKDDDSKKVIYVTFKQLQMAVNLITEFERNTRKNPLFLLGARAIDFDYNIPLVLENDCPGENRKLLIYEDNKTPSRFTSIDDIKGYFDDVESVCFDPEGNGFYVVFESQEAAIKVLSNDQTTEEGKQLNIYWAKRRSHFKAHFDKEKWKKTIRNVDIQGIKISDYQNSSTLKIQNTLEDMRHEAKFDVQKKKELEVLEKKKKAQTEIAWNAGQSLAKRMKKQPTANSSSPEREVQPVKWNIVKLSRSNITKAKIHKSKIHKDSKDGQLTQVLIQHKSPTREVVRREATEPNNWEALRQQLNESLSNLIAKYKLQDHKNVIQSFIDENERLDVLEYYLLGNNVQNIDQVVGIVQKLRDLKQNDRDFDADDLSEIEHDSEEKSVVADWEELVPDDLPEIEHAPDNNRVVDADENVVQEEKASDIEEQQQQIKQSQQIQQRQIQQQQQRQFQQRQIQQQQQRQIQQQQQQVLIPQLPPPQIQQVLIQQLVIQQQPQQIQQILIQQISLSVQLQLIQYAPQWIQQLLNRFVPPHVQQLLVQYLPQLIQVQLIQYVPPGIQPPPPRSQYLPQWIQQLLIQYVPPHIQLQQIQHLPQQMQLQLIQQIPPHIQFQRIQRIPQLSQQLLRPQAQLQLLQQLPPNQQQQWPNQQQQWPNQPNQQFLVSLQLFKGMKDLHKLQLAQWYRKCRNDEKLMIKEIETNYRDIYGSIRRTREKLISWVQRTSPQDRDAILEEYIQACEQQNPRPNNHRGQGPSSSTGVSRKRKLLSRENSAKKRKVDLLKRKIQAYEDKIQQLDDILDYNNQE